MRFILKLLSAGLMIMTAVGLLLLVVSSQELIRGIEPAWAVGTDLPFDDNGRPHGRHIFYHKGKPDYAVTYEHGVMTHYERF